MYLYLHVFIHGSSGEINISPRNPNTSSHTSRVSVFMVSLVSGKGIPETLDWCRGQGASGGWQTEVNWLRNQLLQWASPNICVAQEHLSLGVSLFRKIFNIKELRSRHPTPVYMVNNPQCFWLQLILLELKVHERGMIRHQNEVIEYVSQPKNTTFSQIWYQITFFKLLWVFS